MNTFGLSIVASDKVFFRGRGINIVIPAQDGQVSILAHHADMMITVVPGEMRFQTEDEQWHEAIVGNGFAQIINNRVSLFADSIEKPEDIDEKRAKEALERAEEHATTESVFLIPHFASIAVIPANDEEPTANNIHILRASHLYVTVSHTYIYHFVSSL